MLCGKKCSDESNLPKSWTFSALRMLDLECIDQIVKSQIVQKKLYLASLALLTFEKTNKQKNKTPKSYHVQKRNFVSSCQKFPTWSHWGRWGPPEPINSPRGERCLLFSYNPSEMGKEQNIGKGNCFNFPLLLVSSFGHHMTTRYDSCGQKVDTFALNYATRSCMYHMVTNLIFWSYKPGLILEQIELTLERIAKKL